MTHTPLRRYPDDDQPSEQELLERCPANLAMLLDERALDMGDRPAFMVPDRAPQGRNTWQTITWREARDEIHCCAAGLLALGLKPEQRVAIAAMTRYEWIVADLAVTCAGGAVTTIYPNTTDHDVLYIMQDSGSVMLFAENQAQIAKIQLHDEELFDQVTTIVIMDDDRAPVDRVDQRVITMDELREQGRRKLLADVGCVDRMVATITPDNLATLIYTSGTTGRPKGVELPQRVWTFMAAAVDSMQLVFRDDLQYLWLPLSHVFGRALLSVQLKVGFCSAVDGRPSRIVEGISEVRPTALVGVPRIFEKVRSTVITKNPASGPKAKVARWAFAIGKQTYEDRLAGRPLPAKLAAQYALADKLVFRSVRAALGGRLRLLISGSSKLSPQVQEWFYSAGLTIIEGYGQTESSAIAFLMHPDCPRFGTVGPVLPGLQTKLADDGEVLIKGTTLFRGYHNDPGQTAEAFAGGWFHTGDIGEFDADGYLRITDRKKDLIKTSGGKYVAPQKVEAAITTNIPWVSQAVVLGEGRKYAVALITLDRPALMRWGKKHGHPNASYEELTQLREIHESIARWMERANARLEKWETIKRFAILDHEFSVKDGGVTPNMKVRRNVIAKKYAHVVDSLYDVED